MKLTAAEKRLIQERRTKESEEQAERALAIDAFRQLSNEQILSIGRQLIQGYNRACSPPRCTCDSQVSDPRCPAMCAGWTSRNGGPCNQKPTHFYVKVAL